METGQNKRSEKNFSYYLMVVIYTISPGEVTTSRRIVKPREVRPFLCFSDTLLDAILLLFITDNVVFFDYFFFFNIVILKVKIIRIYMGRKLQYFKCQHIYMYITYICSWDQSVGDCFVRNHKIKVNTYFSVICSKKHIL